MSDELTINEQANNSDIEQSLSEKWEKLGICNDFIFCKVMQDEELLAELVRMILPDLHFTKLEVQAQKSIEAGMDVHGVRFDIFAKDDEGNVVEIEMQVIDTGNLPKRLRYYGSMADYDMLEKGVVYSKLKDSYIIMICPFDYYGKGLHEYTFTNRCQQDDSIEMQDGTTKIVLNANSTENDVEPGLRAFLDYVAGKKSNDPYVTKLDDAVKKARQNKEWRREYMTLMMRDLENQEAGKKIGKAERDREKIAEMLRDGKTPAQIADFCKYPIDLVQKVQEEMLAVAQ